MTHPTQEDDVKALRDALALGLTPGPWRLGNTDGFAAIVRNDAGDIITPTGPRTADAAYIATCYPERIARLLARLEQAERDGPIMERGKRSDGTPYIGTMREVLNDYKSAAQVEAKEGDRARAELAQLRAAIASEAKT